MHNHIEISSSALKHNVAMLQQITGKSQLVPVLKSNAYGHGLLETYLCLKNSQLSWICVNDINEAEILRNAGFKKNLLVCGPVIRSDTQRATSLKLDIFVGSYETLYEILHSKNTRLRIHLEFDTGMSRLGFPPESIDNIKQDIASLNIVGACMHFSNVEDVSNQSYALLQLQKFEAVRKSLRKLFPKCLFHAAASAPALILKQSRFDLCRAGIAVYGLWPSALTKLSFFQSANKLLELKPA